jgi:hypothetical protein
MKTLPETFAGVLGVLRPLLQDPSVLAVTLHGHDTAWVERVGTPARGMEPLSPDAFTRLLDSLGGVPGVPTWLRLGALGHVRVVPAPVGGGAVVVLWPGHLASVTLESLAPADVVDMVLRVLTGGLGVLVVGGGVDARLATVDALWASVPMDRRRALVELAPSGVAPLGALHWCTAGEPGALDGVGALRMAAACLPEMHLGGRAFVEAAPLLGAVLASCAGADGGAARAVVQRLGPDAAAAAAGAFHLMVELGPDPVMGTLRVLALWDGRAVLGGGLPAPWWRATAGQPGGTWQGTPAFAWRVPAQLPRPVTGVVGAAADVGGTRSSRPRTAPRGEVDPATAEMDLRVDGEVSEWSQVAPTAPMSPAARAELMAARGTGSGSGPQPFGRPPSQSRSVRAPPPAPPPTADDFTDSDETALEENEARLARALSGGKKP